MYRLKASLTSPYIVRDLAVIEILFATGARIYELTNLHLQDINLECGTIRLLGKGSKERYIQIANVEVLSILQEYQQQYQCTIEKSGYFFVCIWRGGTDSFAEQNGRGAERADILTSQN